MNYSIKEVAKIVGGKLTKNAEGQIAYLLIDSRKIIFPKKSLFFALSGKRNNGHHYINDAYLAGVRNFVVERLPQTIKNLTHANFIQVKNSLHSLQTLTGYHRNRFNNPVIGITGSNGKTIVKEWIYQCLEDELTVVRNPKSYNSQVGVPLSVWLLNPQAQLGVFEAGISLPGEMQHLEKIVKPQIGIFTNIGDAHQENFEHIAHKVKEKWELFKGTQTLIYCKDQREVSQVVEGNKPPQQTLFSWGTSPQSILRILNITKATNNTKIKLTYKKSEFEVTIPFTDDASLENALHVLSLLLVMGHPLNDATQKLSGLENVAMRLEQKEGVNHCTLINDSYNSDLESLHIALDFLTQQNQHPKKVLILSDIAQSGFEPRELYQRLADMVAQKKIDWLIGIGHQMEAHQRLFQLPIDLYPDTPSFLQSVSLSRFKNMSILIKGARSFRFEQISEKLQKQSHRTVLEIDLNAIEQNLNYFRGLLKPKTGIIAMVKAFSYGSGTHELANLLQFQRVAALAVAFTDEGIALRNDGITLPIMVMNPEISGFKTLMEYQLEPEIYNFDSLSSFNGMAANADLSPYPVHIKLDTGMHRSGFLSEQTEQLLQELKKCKNILVKSIFSHLAAADEPQQDAFTINQIEEFDQRSTLIINELGYDIERHILNSAGIERFPSHQFNKVRLGIGLFGVSANHAQLAQVSSFKTVISQIKKVKAGETVGYSRQGRVTRNTRIAVIPVGYADGLRRILSNGVGKVWINGKLAPIIGNICMDLCMVDVTGLSASEGDVVELFGKNLSIHQVAKWMQTIPYEVLTGISQRVKRTYHLE